MKWKNKSAMSHNKLFLLWQQLQFLLSDFFSVITQKESAAA